MPLSGLIETSKFKAILVRAFILPLAAMAALAAVLFWLIREQTQAAVLVQHTDIVIRQANSVLKLLVDMETGQRGYLVGRNHTFLQPYKSAEKEVGPALSALENAVRDEPSQQRRIPAIRDLYNQWLVNSREEIAARDTRTDYKELFNRGKGKALMDDLRAQIGAFVATEETIRQDRSERAAATARITVLSTVGLVLLLAILLTYFLRTQLLSLSHTYERASSKLVESEHRLVTTLASIGDAVMATDTAGKITFMNPVAEQLTGWTRGEARGREAAQVSHIVHAESRKEVESPVDRVLRDGLTVGLANHALLISKEGTETPIDDSGAPIRDAKGNLLGTVVVFHDISKRKEQEDRILRLNKRLEKAMEETHHRFRNGLQLLTALVELQQSEYEDTVPAEELKRLNTHIQTLNIVHSILMAQAKKEGDATALPVKELLQKMLPHLQTLAPDSRFESSADDVILPTQQATSLGLIINELVLSAARSVRSEITLNFTVEGSQARLEITDDGPGLTEGADPQHGAGLALVDTLARWDLNGLIAYQSRENGGSAAVLTMPVSDDASQQRAALSA